jgi:hypothetical protein
VVRTLPAPVIVQRAQGRHGGEYYCFYYRGRQQGVCDLPSIPVEVMEDAVLASTTATR